MFFEAVPHAEKSTVSFKIESPGLPSSTARRVAAAAGSAGGLPAGTLYITIIIIVT